jgi:predicted nuclease of predicted toxin-antitoxin system
MAIDRIRFHLDEHVNPAIADALRRLDIDVTTTNDVQLRTHTDTVHWEYAQRESRVIVTHDDDFLRLARQHGRHAGIVYCHSKKRTLGEMIRRLIRLSNEQTADQMIGRVVYL